ncbi:hypothetical protein [Bacillus sp. FJAT-47783]|uniref:hypothetical protein n=1 Tax=Bacillus sp. FJAT-47783 TaxID=2922712 RepID=UPI001FAD701A|nr:hypothetical protein [Bacillus sp. FJAT-47783]
MVTSQYTLLLYLKNLSIFHDLDHQVLKKIVAASTLMEVQAFKPIRELLTQEEIYIVLVGELVLYYHNAEKKPFQVSSIQKGEFFSLLDVDTSGLIISPSENTVLMKVPLLFIEHLLIQYPKFKQNVIQAMNHSLRSSYENLITHLGRGSNKV